MNQRNFHLDGLTMNAIETDPNGVIGVDTVFEFTQDGRSVSAKYVGGKIQLGYLVGLINDSELTFRFCQLETDGTLNGGESKCRVEIGDSGLLRIIEDFEWESRPGGGRNVIQEISRLA